MSRPGVTKVLVTGSRGWDNWDLIRSALEPFFGIGVNLMHGDAQGADKMSGYVWQEWGSTDITPVPANWQKFGKVAGYRRNEGMVLSGPDVLVAFLAPCKKKDCKVEGEHYSHGTSQCVEFARSKGIEVVEVPYVAPAKREAPVASNGEAVVEPPPF